MDNQELLKRVKDKMYKSPQVDCKDLSCGVCAYCLYNELEQRLIELEFNRNKLNSLELETIGIDLLWKE